MKELKLGPDGVLPIMEIDLENKPIIFHDKINNDIYNLINTHKEFYFCCDARYAIICMRNNIYNSITCCLKNIHQYEASCVIQFDSMQELHKYYHNQINE